MRKIILLTAVWLTTGLFFQLKAQNEPLDIGKQYFDMGEFFRWGHGTDRKSDTTKAVIAYQKSADLNHPDGIMAMGEMYQEGHGGLTKDLNKAFELFTNAYKSGSGRACYNLGRSYAYGLGCEVDYEKMIFYLNEGIKRNDPTSMYGMGNMLYKGWGIEQSYEKAIAFFEKAAALGSASSNYYLGLCYRNGYGVSKDEQKGREYLGKASNMDYSAVKELKRNASEMDKSKKLENEEFESPNYFTKAKHTASIGSFAGQWTGHITIYDWSGKHKIDEEKIELNIEVDNDKFEGTGTLNGEPITITGFNNQYGIIFSSGKFDFMDHFMDKVSLAIKTGSFESFAHGQTSILAGNISLFSITENAPERPAYLVLVRQKQEKNKVKSAIIPTAPIATEQILPNKNSDTVAPSESIVAQTGNSEKEQSREKNIINQLQDGQINSRVWPVPFKNQLSVQYNLKADSEIEIRLIAMDGRLIDVLTKEKRNPGLQTQQFNLSVPEGTYVLQILSGKQKASHIVIKR